MLTHLRITDFALLDDVTLDPGPGFNVLTGETGAGKSLLVDAVALLRGGRASSEVVRTGAEEARIEAVFEPEGMAAEALRSRLARAGLEGDGEELVLRRTIGAAGGAAGAATGDKGGKAGKGRGRVWVNGALSTAAVLADLGGGLIDLAGQHEHQTLVDPAQHLVILDAHGVDAAAVAHMATTHGELLAAAEALSRLSLDERQRAEREDFLRFQLRELDEASPDPGEDERLKAERERLKSAGKLHAAARRAEQALYAREASIVDEVSGLVRELDDAARSDEALARLARQIDEARVGLEDAAESLRRYADGMHADPERLAWIDERLHLLGKLLRKHGPTLDDVIERRRTMADELVALGAHELRRAEAEDRVQRARKAAGEAARALSAAREVAAAALSKRVSAELGLLGMAGARLHVEVAPRTAREGDEPALIFDGRRLGAGGWDRVEFLLAANVGDDPRPLARVASGGELSRIMLALKQVVARADSVATYVFDEVDTGIGGPVADVVGQRLKQVAAEKQVLCVTHLPQIAAYADAHFHVSKRTVDGRTSTVVRRLTADERIEELARMVGGAKVTARARAHAEELIRQASQP